MERYFDDPREYEFTLPDGSKQYEFCGSVQDVWLFTKVLKAKVSKPVPMIPLTKDEI